MLHLGMLPLSVEVMMWRKGELPLGFCQVTLALCFLEAVLLIGGSRTASSVGLPNELPLLPLGRICNWKIPLLLLVENSFKKCRNPDFGTQEDANKI